MKPKINNTIKVLRSAIFSGLIIIMIFHVSCDKNDRDTELPEIGMAADDHFPQNCDTLYVGEEFTFKSNFTDNLELGSYSIDIHHNFDHHSHSTELSDCPMEPEKEADNPFVYIRQFEIPDNLREYNASHVIEVPEGVDSGDYHMTVRLTDKTGWQAIKGISIKVVERP